MSSEPSESLGSQDKPQQPVDGPQYGQDKYVESNEENAHKEHPTEDSLDRWRRLVDGHKSPTNNKTEVDDVRSLSDENEAEGGQKRNAPNRSNNAKTEADNLQTSARGEKKPVTEVLADSEQDSRRRRRRRNQPSWYDIDRENAEQKQLAHTRQPEQQLQQPLQLELQRQQEQLEFQRQQMQMQMQQQQMENQRHRRNNSLKLRLDLNLDVEVTLKAKIRGDLTLALLYVHLILAQQCTVPPYLMNELSLPLWFGSRLDTTVPT
ncbi:hypothetical protein GGS21DRAFT_133851 [Xylaria nigripes]|nr:hypothetical protein GGS21DRAFT_133851 [Xylaria nigripes]